MAKQDISVKQLVAKVISGELTLPEMQRQYVWKGVKVRDLLDSLYRGYPSGSILVWETDQIDNDRNLQIHDAATTPLGTKLLLLDGQQRLTSLTAILNGSLIQVRKRKRPIDIMFNLEHPDSLFEDNLTADPYAEMESDDTDEEDDEPDDDDDDENNDNDSERDIQEELRKRTFVVATKTLKNSSKWVSVTDIFKKTDSQLLKPLGISSDDPNWDKYSERIQRVRKIEEYQYVMQILDKTMSYEEVTEIFVRVNSLGVKLRGSDLALAQITSRWRGFMKELEQFAGEFKHNSEYLQESGILVKALVSFATDQSKFKTIGKVSVAKFQETWETTKHGIRYAINFINSNARIDNLNLMSSPFLLIPIAYYAMKKNEQLTEEEERKLQLWLYVAHMKGRYSHGSTEGFLDSDLTSIRTGSIDTLLNSLRLHVKDFYVTDEELQFKNRRSPYFSLLFFIAKQKGLKDWTSGLSISEGHKGNAHSIQFHHIFPKSQLREAKFDRKEINDIANLTFIGGRTNRNISNKLPISYLGDFVEKRGEQIYDGNHIPRDKSLWEIDNYHSFLEYRRSELAKEINALIESLINPKGQN